MDVTTQNRIKPLLPHTIHIKNAFNFSSYLVRRPKQTLTFKFTRQRTLSCDSKRSQRKSELKLQKALSLLKSVKKLDLSQFQINNKHINHIRLQSCFKSIPKISTLLWTRYQLDHHLETNLAEKSFKYLPRLQNLAYKLADQVLPTSTDGHHRGQCLKDADPLNHLKYHSNVESLQIETSGHGFDFSRVFSTGLNRYPTSLKHLTITSLLNTDVNLHLEHLTRLESASLKFDHDDCLVRNLDALSKLPKFQTLNLELNGGDIATIHPLLLKISERKILKKLRLTSSSLLIDKQALKAIQEFHQLTHFHLQVILADSQSEETLNLIADCLENMKHLEDLNLSIRKRSYFQSFDALQLICQKINNLEFLKHLDLGFVPLMVFTKIPDFLLHLQNTFTKPIKLQTLSLSYVQLDPAQALLDLSNLLQSSSTSLQKLKINFGYCFADHQNRKSIIELLKSLENIQVFEFSGLEIDHQNFLAQIVEAISPYKYLRGFHLGDIQDKVPLKEYRNALDAIFTKRGLREFRCNTSKTLLKGAGFKERRSGDLYSFSVDMREVEKKNPFLETFYLSFPFGRYDVLKDLSDEVDFT